VESDDDFFSSLDGEKVSEPVYSKVETLFLKITSPLLPLLLSSILNYPRRLMNIMLSKKNAKLLDGNLARYVDYLLARRDYAQPVAYRVPLTCMLF
jgi:hypothetical protein